MSSRGLTLAGRLEWWYVGETCRPPKTCPTDSQDVISFAGDSLSRVRPAVIQPAST